ncbi:M48 family metalloprotease, partial [Anaeromyxobacter sp. PSR-1]
MAAQAPPAGRATLDFFAAQRNARRRTTVLVIAFAVALAAVIAVVYLALAVALGLGAGTGGWAVDASGAVYGPPLLQPGLLALTALGVGAITGVGGAWHAVRLSSGGGAAVAELLGGTPVDRATQDPAERRLVNVTEEMALAAGMPVPRLYVLRGEGGINAFAAGYTPGHSVVAVTRGALERLTRDELQGVVAHELSHVLNADTRIDLRLMAAVGGLGFLTLLGRLLLDVGSGPRRSRDRNRGAIALVGLGLLLAGAMGSLCGRLVRFAVARQREWLADASAVQFTRNPDGLAGALRKIAAE